MVYLTLTYKQKAPKSRAGKREIPVDPSFFRVLDDWRDYMAEYRKKVKAVYKTCNADLVFSNYSGTIRSYQSLRKKFSEFLIENGLDNKRITFHCLRRTLASKMRTAGIDTATISAYIGHEAEDHKVTNLHYAEVEMKPKEEAAKAYYEHMKNIFEIVQ